MFLLVNFRDKNLKNVEGEKVPPGILSMTSCLALKLGDFRFNATDCIPLYDAVSFFFFLNTIRSNEDKMNRIAICGNGARYGGLE